MTEDGLLEWMDRDEKRERERKKKWMEEEERNIQHQHQQLQQQDSGSGGEMRWERITEASQSWKRVQAFFHLH